ETNAERFDGESDDEDLRGLAADADLQLADVDLPPIGGLAMTGVVCVEDVAEARDTLEMLCPAAGRLGGALAASAAVASSSSAVERAVRQHLAEATRRAKFQVHRMYRAAHGSLIAAERLSSVMAKIELPEADFVTNETKHPADACFTRSNRGMTTGGKLNFVARKLLRAVRSSLRASAAAAAECQTVSAGEKRQKEIAMTHHLFNQSKELREKRQTVAALGPLRTSLSLTMSAEGEHAAKAAPLRGHLSQCLMELNRTDEALEEMLAGVASQGLHLSPGDPKLCVALMNIGALWKQKGQPEEALKRHYDTYAALVHNPDLQSADVKKRTYAHLCAATLQEHIGDVEKKMGDEASAGQAYLRAVNHCCMAPGQTEKDTRREQMMRQKYYGSCVSAFPLPAPRTMKLVNDAALDGFGAPDAAERDTLGHFLAADPEAAAANPTEDLDSLSLRETFRAAKVQPWICRLCSKPNDAACTMCRCGTRRPLLKTGVLQIFKGTVVCFSGLPKSLNRSFWKESRYAEQCGATVVDDASKEVTYLFYFRGSEGSQKVKEAEQCGVKHILPVEFFYRCLESGALLNPKHYGARAADAVEKKLAVDAVTGRKRSQSAPVRSYRIQPCYQHWQKGPALPRPAWIIPRDLPSPVNTVEVLTSSGVRNPVALTASTSYYTGVQSSIPMSTIHTNVSAVSHSLTTSWGASLRSGLSAFATVGTTSLPKQCPALPSPAGGLRS
ncbi:hypothetical protein DIPPA_07455, partial [Diplonema papillatum]